MTYTLNVNVAYNFVTGLTVSDPLPAQCSFVSFGTSPAGTSAVTNVAGGVTVMNWTFPTLAPGNYQLSYIVTINTFTQGGPLVNCAAYSYPGSLSKSACATLMVMGNYTVRIGVYNEAGELVKTLLVTEYSQPLVNLQFQNGNLINGLNSPVTIMDQNHFITVWDGTNQDGSPVPNGDYYLKVDNIDSFGVDSSVILNVVVSRQLEKVTIDIYNEAGEIVRSLYSVVENPQGVVITSVKLSSGVLEPGSPTDGTLTIKTNNGVQVVWDGYASNGTVVPNGNYFIEVHSTDGKGGETMIVTSVLVVNNPKPSLAKVWAYPNPLTDGIKIVTFQGAVPGLSLSVKIYDLAGELVTEVRGVAGTSQAAWNAAGIASGLYICKTEQKDSGDHVIARQTLKILVKQ